jgi:hypothetical protein
MTLRAAAVQIHRYVEMVEICVNRFERCCVNEVMNAATHSDQRFQIRGSG